MLARVSDQLVLGSMHATAIAAEFEMVPKTLHKWNHSHCMIVVADLQALDWYKLPCLEI